MVKTGGVIMDEQGRLSPTEPPLPDVNPRLLCVQHTASVNKKVLLHQGLVWWPPGCWLQALPPCRHGVMKVIVLVTVSG